MKRDDLLSKLQGCLCGVAIGDAMGMSWEMMTPNGIFFATKGQGVKNLSNTVQRTISETSHLKAGEITDDWQLTRAIARAIINSKKLDSITIALEHIAEFNQSTLGWGKSTKTAVEAMKNYFDSLSKQDRKPNYVDLQLFIDEAIKNTPGTGNGVAMKSAPIAIYHLGLSYNYLLDNVFVLGKMTHRDPRASYAAGAIAAIIKRLLEYGRPVNTARSIFLDFDLVSLLARMEIMKSSERPHEQFKGDSFTGRLINLFSTDLIYCPIGATGVPGSLIKQIGTSCLALESIPFSIAIFLRNLTDFRKGILEAVNCGGDTDSNASMVGAMIGANIGIENIPSEWIEAVPACQEALELAEQLYNLLKERKS